MGSVLNRAHLETDQLILPLLILASGLAVVNNVASLLVVSVLFGFRGVKRRVSRCHWLRRHLETEPRGCR